MSSGRMPKSRSSLAERAFNSRTVARKRRDWHQLLIALAIGVLLAERGRTSHLGGYLLTMSGPLRRRVKLVSSAKAMLRRGPMSKPWCETVNRCLSDRCDGDATGAVGARFSAALKNLWRCVSLGSSFASFASQARRSRMSLKLEPGHPKPSQLRSLAQGQRKELPSWSFHLVARPTARPGVLDL